MSDTDNAHARRSRPQLHGMIEVDSGTVVVGHPSYLLPRADRAEAGVDHEAVIQAPDEPASYLDARPVLVFGRFWSGSSAPSPADRHPRRGRWAVHETLQPGDDAPEGAGG